MGTNEFWRALLLCVAVILGASSSARASDWEEDEGALSDVGPFLVVKSKYRDKDYHKALDLATTIYEEICRANPTGCEKYTDENSGVALDYMYRCSRRIDRYEDALRHLKKLAKYNHSDDNKIRIDTAIRTIEELLKYGNVVFRLNEKDVRIIVDERILEEGSFEAIKLTSGKHRIRAEKDGYHPVEREFEVPGARVVVVRLELLPIVSEPIEELPSAYPWQWVTLGTGLALGATGGLLWGLGEQDLDDVGSGLVALEADGGPAANPGRFTELNELYDEGRAKRNAGYGLLAVGGGCLVASATLFILDATIWAHHDDDAGAAANARRPAVAPFAWAPAGDGFGLGLGGRF